MNTYYVIGLSIVGLFLYYIITRFTFDILLRGFAPFISSRPWAVARLLEELDKEQIRKKPVIYSLSCGKSGFLLEAGKKYYQAELIGVEHDFIPYILEKIQLFLRRSDIRIIHKKNIYKLDVSKADLIYCYLDIHILRDMPKKLKFECKPGTIIVSNGFPIPNLPEKRSVEIPDQPRKLGFLSRRKKLIAPKAKENKRANLIYIYEI